MPPPQFKDSSTSDCPSVAKTPGSFGVRFHQQVNLTRRIGNILMISEGRSGSDNVFTLRDGSFLNLRLKKLCHRGTES
jgi:hypothetical protein